jgi:hypothetical protein
MTAFATGHLPRVFSSTCTGAIGATARERKLAAKPPEGPALAPAALTLTTPMP